MRNTYRFLYRLRLTPWENSRPPQQLIALARVEPPRIAVDLGCGTGTQARYLAGLGWKVTAVDYLPEAIAGARRRDPTCQVTWRTADVAAPEQVDPDGSLAGTVNLLLDNGCMHGLSPQSRQRWAGTVTRLAAADACLLLRAAAPGRRLVGPRGAARTELLRLLGPHWQSPAALGNGWHLFRRGQGRRVERMPAFGQPDTAVQRLPGVGRFD
ncbi:MULTISPECIES: class I SAM-dependent methyltransferase [unclassified Micromonospora]|uniref:class I SAM-dependent methyltransferase n=1 Tax=unclassified Micromonospora TaxID=2617518 RepID=UPI00362CAAC0